MNTLRSNKNNNKGALTASRKQSRIHHKRKKRSQSTTMMSTATTWCLLLLSPSCISAFSHPETRTSVLNPTRSSTTTYKSREGNDSPSNNKHSCRRRRDSTPTFLNYRDDASEEIHSQQLKGFWNFLVPGVVKLDRRDRGPYYHVSQRSSSNSNPNDNQQYLLDSYLESIDRRYKRIHEDETKNSQSSQGAGFTSAIGWLMNSETYSQVEEKRKQEDALCVLGLADLASTRLLQKHHLPIPKSRQAPTIQDELREDDNSIVIDISATDHPVSDIVTTTKSPVAMLTQILTIIKNFRSMCSHRYAIACLKSKATIKTMSQTISIGVTKLEALVGGKWARQATKAATTVAIAYALMATRPVIKTVFKA